MKRVKLTVAYDGTNYCGWQVQPNGMAVQEVLNRCLSELLKTKIEVIGASRTDAGCMHWAMLRYLTQRHGCRRRSFPMR